MARDWKTVAIIGGALVLAAILGPLIARASAQSSDNYQVIQKLGMGNAAKSTGYDLRDDLTGIHSGPQSYVASEGGANVFAIAAFQAGSTFDQFDAMQAFYLAHGTRDNPLPIANGDRITIAPYVYGGPNAKYQQLGAFVFKVTSVGDYNGGVSGALEIWLSNQTAEFGPQDPQLVASIDQRGNLTIKGALTQNGKP